MNNHIPEWITILALDIYRLIQKYDALASFQEKVREWAIGHEAKANRHLEWRRQRNLHFEQAVNSDPRLQDEKSGPPNEGWEWENYPLNISPQIDPDTKRSIKIVKAWVPPELLRDSEPDIKHILPLSREQQLSLTEKYTLLAAIYDFGRKGTDEIPPWEWPDLNTDVSSDELADAKKCLSFESLCDAASSLHQDNEGWLRTFLYDVENDLRKNRPSAKNPILSKTFLNNLLRASIKHLPYVGPFLYDVIYGTVDQSQTELLLHSTTGDNVETEPDTKSEREGTIEGRKPWYKKTWIIIVGFVTVLTGLAALVCICESETGKHFINSFKRKPSISVDYRRTKLYARTKKRVDDFYESIRNEKLDPWLFINAGVEVRVTKHNGDVINISGVLFTGSPRLIFWSDDFIPPFIEDTIIKVFDQTIDECRKNGLDPEIYVYEAKRILSDFIYKIYNSMADMDKKLLKQVNPENSGRRDVKLEIEKMCKCLDEQYNAALLLASGNENAK